MEKSENSTDVDSFTLKADEASLINLIKRYQSDAKRAEATYMDDGDKERGQEVGPNATYADLVSDRLQTLRPVNAARFIVGYAGWGAGQLEEELMQGSWLQLPFNDELVFDTAPEKMWAMAYSSIGVAPEKIAPMQHTYLN